MTRSIAQEYLDEAEAFVAAEKYAEAAKIYLWFDSILKTANTRAQPDNFFNLPGLRENGFTPVRLKSAIAQIADNSPERFAALKTHIGRLSFIAVEPEL